MFDKETNNNGELTGRTHRILIIAAGLIAAGIIVGLSILVFMPKKSVKAPVNSQTESQRVISEVTKVFMAPADEVPTVAKIKDKSKLSSNQEFYKNAMDGDYLLVYSKNKLAVIYRESAGKIVNVSAVNLTGNASQ